MTVEEMTHVMVTVVEKSKHGMESRTEADQMMTMKTRAIVLDILGSSGRTMAIYLKGAVLVLIIITKQMLEKNHS